MGFDETKDYLEDVIEEGLGLNLNDPNYKDTPERITKMYHNEFFKNIDTPFTDFALFPNSHTYDQIILSGPIHFTSMCSHHFLPFYGQAWLLYIPNDNLIGLSKIARLIEHYSARPQLQEHLCHEIINMFVYSVKPLGAMLVMKATHCCMSCRGANQPNTKMITSVVSGCFVEHPTTKEEGLELIKLSLMGK